MTAISSPPEALTAHDLYVAIANRYEAPEWHIEKEVTFARRRLDVVALNMWGARKYRIVGFELKVNRGDWLRELSAFQKSEEWMAVVDSFWIVTPPKLVKDEELPAGWGLLELCGTRLMTRRHAAVRDGSTVLPREVAARFISRLASDVARKDREAEWKASAELRVDIETSLRASLARAGEHDRNELAQLRADHTELLGALGLRRSDWEVQRSALRAAGVFAAARGNTSGLRAQLERNATALEQHLSRIREAAAALGAEV